MKKILFINYKIFIINTIIITIQIFLYGAYLQGFISLL